MRSATTPAYRSHAALLAALLALVVLPAPARAAVGFVIRGAGNGHGVGMSQYGAEGFAGHGRDYRWILAHYYSGTQIGPVDPHTVIRVLLPGHGTTFSGADHAAGKRLKPSESYVVRPNADGTLTLIDAKGKKLATVAAPLAASGPGPLNLAGVGSYRGSLEFRPDGSGGLEVVDALGIEDYVRGVIADEMPSTWAPAALEAQAVAARTYALTSDVAGGTFDVYSDTRSQMYGGVGAETAATDAAVQATRGQIVTYDGAPAITYFFASSGGHTENVENVWTGATPSPWLRGVSDPFDGVASNPLHRWSYALTLHAAQARLAAYVRGRLIGVAVRSHGVSPRIVTADVVGTRGTTSVTGAQLQQAFGLPSTYASFFTIATLPGRTPGPGTPVSVSAVLAGAQADVALLSLIGDLLHMAARGIHGVVYPPPAGRPAIEELINGAWRTVAHTRVRRTGLYSVALRHPGTYRIRLGAVAGPAVGIG